MEANAGKATNMNPRKANKVGFWAPVRVFIPFCQSVEVDERLLRGWLAFESCPVPSSYRSLRAFTLLGGGRVNEHSEKLGPLSQRDQRRRNTRLFWVVSGVILTLSQLPSNGWFWVGGMGLEPLVLVGRRHPSLTTKPLAAAEPAQTLVNGKD